MEIFPTEILEHIFSYLDNKTFINSIPKICRKWRYLCKEYFLPGFILNPLKCEINLTKNMTLYILNRFTYAFSKSSSDVWFLNFCKNQIMEGLNILNLSNYNPNKIYENDEIPIFSATEKGHLDVLKFLINLNADINKTDKFGNSIIFIASYWGNLNIIKYLIEEKNFDPNYENSQGYNLVDAASRGGYLDIVKYLIEEAKVDPNSVDHMSWTPLRSACFFGHTHVSEYLFSIGAYGWTRLLDACKNGDFNLVRSLVLDFGSDVNETSNDKETPLHVAVGEGYLDIVKFLIEEGKADIYKLNDFGQSLIDIAIHENNSEIICYLESLNL